MVTVKLFGLLQEGAMKTRLEVSAGTVRSALAQVRIAVPDIDMRQVRQAIMFVNGVEKRGVTRLSLLLQDGDELVLLSPVSGG